jgi:uncharacterized protein (DUF169 family)
MSVDMSVYDREKSFRAIRDCREQVRQGTQAMWLNAAYAAARGATLAQLSDATGFSADIVRRELRRVRGRA